LHFFNVTLLEHLLRTLAASRRQAQGLREAADLISALPEARRALQGVVDRRRPSQIEVEVSEGSPLQAAVPEPLARALGVEWIVAQGAAGERLARGISRANGEPLIALSADTVIDVRVIERLMWREREGAFVSEGETFGAARFDQPRRADFAGGRPARDSPRPARERKAGATVA
jgi:hypothetical protein